jgi:V/A-type H+-transporting ATPase subunit D
MAGETVTRHSFLALRDEHGFLREGFEFLDEKRLLLAQRILLEHDAYRASRDALAESWHEALATLADALGESGLLALAVAERPRIHLELPELKRHAHFGVPLWRVEREDTRTDEETIEPDRLCALAFARITALAALTAALAGNLHRLIAEYRRTDRRARALENVVLPEVGKRLRDIEAALEDGDLEETLRTRLAIATPQRLL